MEAKTQRGAKKLLHEGYQYTVNNRRGTTVYWQCEDRACTGRLVEKTDGLRRTKEHNHAPDPAASEVNVAP